MTTRNGRKRIRDASVIKFGPMEFGAAVSPKRPSNDGGNDDLGYSSKTRTTGGRVLFAQTKDAQRKFDSTTPGESQPPLPPPTLAVSHGCLLIPAVVAVWWFWSKRATQKACRRSRRVLATVLHRPPPSPNSGRNRTYLRSLACGAEGPAEDDKAGTYPGASSAPIHDSTNDDGAPSDGNDDVYESWEQVVATNEEAASHHRALRLVRWMRGPSELQHAHEHFKQKRSLESSLLRRRMMMPNSVADPCRVSTSPPAHGRSVNNFDEDDDDDVFSRNWDYIQDLTDIELCSMGSVRISASDDDATADSVEVISRSNRCYRQFL